MTRIVAGLGCTLLVCLAALAQPESAAAQDEKSLLYRMIEGVHEWQFKAMRASADDLEKAEARLREVRPLLEAQIYEGDSNYKEALDTLTRRAADLHKRLNDGRLSNPTVLDGLALLELGRLYSLTGRHIQARECAQMGLKVQEAIAEQAPSHREALLLQARLTLATVLARGGQPHDAVPHANKALEAVRSPTRALLAADPNLPVVPCLLLRSELHQAVGEHAAALATADEALRRWQPKQSAVKDLPGDLTLGGILLRKGTVLVLLGRTTEAWPLLEESLKVVRVHCAAGHPLLGLGHATLANVALLQGDSLRAHRHINESLREFNRCFPEKHFPNGTPFVLRARNSLGELLCHLGAAGKALELYQETQRKAAALYGSEPHADQLETLLSSVTAARQAGDDELAGRFATQAVDLARKLYPRSAYLRGHRHLALALLELASVQAALNQPAYQANLDKADTIYRRLYPEGHPDRTALLLTRAVIALGKQDCAQAHKLFRQLLGAQEEEARQFGVLASSAEALAFARQRQTILSWLLVAGRHLSEQQRGEDYEAVWACKQLATRLLRERLRASHLAQASSPEARDVGNQLIDCYRQIHNHVRRTDQDGKEARDEELKKLYDQVRELEGKRNKHLPPAIRERSGAQAGPGDLARALPKDVAFVDFVRYEDLSTRPPTRWYAAFVLTRDAAPRPIDLGSAKEIDAAVQGWREAVEKWDPRIAHPADLRAVSADARRHAENLRKWVWQPITRDLPQTITTFYLAPDGDLAGLTFAALPTGRGDRILLEEELLIGYVPHGPFLLEQLTHPTAAVRPADPLLVLGNVEFGRAPEGVRPRFAPLSSGAQMIARFRGLDSDHLLPPLEGNGVTLAQFQKAMSAAGLAYVATHGYFARGAWELEQASWAGALTGYQPGGALPLVGLGRRSPLSYTGLALSGGNRTDSKEPGIATGEMIAELRLENLKLAVLCACETGLGEHVAGEGVQALLRAFHLAGCPRVVASLWGGYIHPTDMILEKFTRDVWKGGKAPLLALRDAQREVYYHPESVRFERNGQHVRRYGSGDNRTIRDSSVEEKPTPVDFKPEGPRAAVKVWGAHILSGVGR